MIGVMSSRTVWSRYAARKRRITPAAHSGRVKITWWEPADDTVAVVVGEMPTDPVEGVGREPAAQEEDDRGPGAVPVTRPA